MPVIRVVSLLVLGCAISAAIYFGTSVPKRVQAPTASFPTLFPRPTGHNGYEELVHAADLASASSAWQTYEKADYGPRGPTLETKRAILADPAIQQILETLRAGLRKPIRSPRDAPELYTLFPDLREFRLLARILRVEMEVLFADGRSSAALDCLQDGLLFGRSVQACALVSGVVGMYIENTVLDMLVANLDQLSSKDCDKLLLIADDHLESPDPQLTLIREEGAMVVRSFQNNRDHALTLLAKLDPGPNAGATEHRDYDDVCRWLRANPMSGPALFDQAADLARAHFDRLLTQISRPVWERRFPVPVERESRSARLLYSLCPPSYSRMGDRFARVQAKVQILGVHAAIVRYHMRHRQWPNTIEELKLGSLTVDPFAGTSFKYRRNRDNSYEIASIGANDTGDSKHSPTGARIPMTIQYRPRTGH